MAEPSWIECQAMLRGVFSEDSDLVGRAGGCCRGKKGLMALSWALKARWEQAGDKVFLPGGGGGGM